MRNYFFMQVDAFSQRPLAGNPCAVIFDADDISPQQRLAIAKEMNLAETAFIQKSAQADFGVRYFTPAEEIPLAGHPTIATVFALIDHGRLPLPEGKRTLSLELAVGPIQVEIQASHGRLQRITMWQQKPRFLQTYPAELILPIFGLTEADLLPDLPIQTVSTGTPQLMLPLRHLDALQRATLDIPAYAALQSQVDFFSPHLFCLSGISPEGSTFARHFGLPPDLLEDPFTGSATGGMAAYLWHYGLLAQPDFVAEQGHWLDRPGQAFVEVVGPRQDIETVKVGGTAVAVVRGQLTLP